MLLKGGVPTPSTPCLDPPMKIQRYLQYQSFSQLKKNFPW